MPVADASGPAPPSPLSGPQPRPQGRRVPCPAPSAWTFPQDQGRRAVTELNVRPAKRLQALTCKMIASMSILGPVGKREATGTWGEVPPAGFPCGGEEGGGEAGDPTANPPSRSRVPPDAWLCPRTASLDSRGCACRAITRWRPGRVAIAETGRPHPEVAGSDDGATVFGSFGWFDAPASTANDAGSTPAGPGAAGHLGRGGRVVERAGLENRYTARPCRGFESPPLRLSGRLRVPGSSAFFMRGRLRAPPGLPHHNAGSDRRYPTPGSVTRKRGWAGSDSSFLRSSPA